MTDTTTPTYNQSDVLLRLHAARVLASEKQPYLSNALFAMVPIKVDGLGTMASDAKWRLYYDPAKIMEWPVDELCGVVLHEVSHCMRDHAPRFEAMGENRRFAPTFNIAGDSLINADLREDHLSLPEGAVYIETLQEQGVAVTREMSAEQIYHLIREKQDENCTCGDKGDKSDNGNQSGDQSGNDSGDGPGDQPGDENGTAKGNQPGDGEGDQNGDQSGSGNGTGDQQGNGTGSGGNQPDPNCPVHGDQRGMGWDCGSAADGVRRDYEAEGDKVDPGVDADRADLIRQQTAVEIENHVRNRGTVPAGWARWARELLNPTVDWRKELASIVRRNFAQIAGLRDYTYKRPSRRSSAMKQTGQNIVLPAMRQPEPPKVSIVIDTSGSMSDEMLTWALSETQGVLRSLGSGGRNVSVISCDASANVQRVTKISDVKLLGGGGTDMRVGIDAAMKSRPKPDLICLITDGFTPYPDEPLKGCSLIVALTDEAASDAVPTWARKVVVTQ